jgi:hypothetical protein
MYAEQWLELLLKEIRTNQEKAETCHRDFLARLDADLKAW